jgi:hypothetical protein
MSVYLVGWCSLALESLPVPNGVDVWGFSFKDILAIWLVVLVCVAVAWVYVEEFRKAWHRAK